MRKAGVFLGSYPGVAALAAFLVLLNWAAGSWVWRIDLTEDARYTLSQVTLEVLDSLEAPVEVEVFFVGDFPPTIQRLQTATETLLEELNAYSSSRLRIRYTNPKEAPGVRAVFDSLGILPGEVVIRTSDLEESRQAYYPVVRLAYQGRTQYLDLLKGTQGATNDLDMLRTAEAQLEYKLTASLRRIVLARPYTLGIYSAAHAYTPEVLGPFLQTASRLYRIRPVELQNGPALVPPAWADSTQAPNTTVVDVLLIAQPDSALSEREKYTIEQYVLRGGKVLWLVDQLRVSQTDLNSSGRTLTELRKLNLDDYFFKRGVKINYDLALDVQCGFIDAVANVNGRDQLTPQRWVYFPLVRTFPDHPITRNLDGVLLRFASTLDTVATPGIEKTVLLRSSPYSKGMKGPQVVDFNETIRYRPNPQDFVADGFALLGLLLEGRFQSLFVGRKPPTDSLAPTPPALPHLASSAAHGAEIILADGALILGNHSRRGSPGLVLGNETLLLNAIDYLIGDAALLKIRAREVRYRLLDRQKVIGNEGTIRALNLVLPLLLIVGLGVVRHWRRRRRYRKPVARENQAG